MSAIWYSHWLEMRGRALLLLAFLLGLAVMFGAAFRQSDRMHQFAEAERALSKADYWTFSPHGFTVYFLMFIVVTMIAGTGINSRDLWGYLHRDAYLPLSMPVSRVSRAVTRQAVAVMVSGLAFSLGLALNVVIAKAWAAPIPWMAMAKATVAGFAISIPAALLAGTALVWFGTSRYWSGVTVSLSAFYAATVVRMAIDRWVAGGSPWLGAGAVVAATVVFGAAYLWSVRRRDY
jgi:hypothetical protein